MLLLLGHQGIQVQETRSSCLLFLFSLVAKRVDLADSRVQHSLYVVVLFEQGTKVLVYNKQSCSPGKLQEMGRGAYASGLALATQLELLPEAFLWLASFPRAAGLPTEPLRRQARKGRT